GADRRAAQARRRAARGGARPGGHPGEPEGGCGMTAALWIWAITLGVVTVVIVPVAVHLLHRTLRAARSIERYTRDSLAAGVGIPSNTAAIAALDDPTRAAAALLEAAEALKRRTAEVSDAVAGAQGKG